MSMQSWFRVSAASLLAMAALGFSTAASAQLAGSPPKPKPKATETENTTMRGRIVDLDVTKTHGVKVVIDRGADDGVSSHSKVFFVSATTGQKLSDRGYTCARISERECVIHTSELAPETLRANPAVQVTK